MVRIVVGANKQHLPPIISCHNIYNRLVDSMQLTIYSEPVIVLVDPLNKSN